MRYGFIHTAHLRSPISNLPFDPCRRQLRSPISNLDLQSPPRRWMPGARIYDLCSPSPISTFDPGNCQHDPQSVISIFHLQPSLTVWENRLGSPLLVCDLLSAIYYSLAEISITLSGSCQALSGASVRPAVRCCQCCRVLSGACLTGEGFCSCQVLSGAVRGLLSGCQTRAQG